MFVGVVFGIGYFFGIQSGLRSAYGQTGMPCLGGLCVIGFSNLAVSVVCYVMLPP